MDVMPHTKKGQGLAALPTYVQIFVVAGIFLGVGALILGEFIANITDAQAIAATQNASSGLVELASFLPIIGLVIAAVILLSIVLSIQARG